jgi:DNA-binding MarR family transcriptional regulator
VDGLAQLSFQIQRLLGERATAHDLSMIQTRLLGVLRDREPTMQELARQLQLDKSSATGLVDRAETRGFVQRTPSLDDRRTIRVKLTSKGRKIGSSMVNGFESDITAATRSLSKEEQKQLSKLASRVVGQISQSK